MLRLRELRKEKDKTQVELASVLGVSRQVYANYENGINEPSIDILIALANYFECSIDYLVSREDDFGNVTVANVGEKLPADAQELVDMFLSLSPAHRIQILEYTKYFTERENATKKRG